MPGPTTIDSPERMRREPEGLRTIVPLVDLRSVATDAGTLEPQLEVRARHERARRRHRDELRRCAEGAGDARGEGPPADEHRAGHRMHRPAADAEGGRLHRRLVGRPGDPGGACGGGAGAGAAAARRTRATRVAAGHPRRRVGSGSARPAAAAGDRGDGRRARSPSADQRSAPAPSGRGERPTRSASGVGIGAVIGLRRHRPAARHQDGVGIRGRGIRPSRHRHRRPLHRRRPEARAGMGHRVGRLAEPAERGLAPR